MTPKVCESNLIDEKLTILYEDDHCIAIHKPHGLLVHRTSIAADVNQFALQLLRDQLGYRVYPIHRLDRKTAGVLLFAKTKDILGLLQKGFHDRQISKQYEAIVRGFAPSEGTIDYPLRDGEKSREAITHFKCLEQFELDIPSHRHSTSRYSWVRLTPHTGRFHQLRRHMAHIDHPIIGDRPHGCNKQNKIWKHQLGMDTMLLVARSLSWTHVDDQSIRILSPYSLAFSKALDLLHCRNQSANSR